jgi:hypothetical protein
MCPCDTLQLCLWDAQVSGEQVQLATEVRSLAVLPPAVSDDATPLTCAPLRHADMPLI